MSLVITCEHANWALPTDAAGQPAPLGVTDQVLRSQASWDHGALPIATALAGHFAAPLLAGSYSRMWVDLNRPADHPDVVPAHSYGADVPGNVELTPAARATRIAQYHTPYWQRAAAMVDAAVASQGACLHISSHSFCPSLDPPKRNFDLGVLFDPANRFEAAVADALLADLAARGVAARANQPYGGTGPALVASLRATRQGVRYAGIEFEASHAVTMRPDGLAWLEAHLVASLETVVGHLHQL